MQDYISIKEKDLSSILTTETFQQLKDGDDIKIHEVMFGPP